jgi:sulfite oxidase
MAAGGSVEPFWAIYGQHKTAEVMEILEELRIGSLNPEEVAKMRSARKEGVEGDPFSTDPQRHPALVVNAWKPFNAETPAALLMDSFRTPNELFFVRNHMHVPDINGEAHKVEVEGVGVKRSVSLSVEDLRTGYEPHSVISAVQCAGNRRCIPPIDGLFRAVNRANFAGMT